MQILTFTTLYPDSSRPRHGIFIENRIRRVAQTGEASVRVVCPCPWFPFRAAAFGQYAEFARVPRFELRQGIEVHHPRYPVIPKFGMSAAPYLMYLAVRSNVRRLLKTAGGFDLIDAHYFYPDGVAAIMLGRQFGKPVTITARGSDLNVLPRYSVPRRLIRWAAEHAQGLVTVSQALRERLHELGIARERVRVLRNGVDLELFRPLDRAACRRAFGFNGVTLLSVGNLVPIKSHETTIEALLALPETRLVLVGEGPARASLTDFARRIGVAGRVEFLGNRPHDSLPELYNAADLLVLASRHEGWPNVLLEAMACGTPVVVSDIPGSDEIVPTEAVGRRFRCGDSSALAHEIKELLEHPPTAATIRVYAEGFGWDATTRGQLALFHEILEGADHMACRR